MKQNCRIWIGALVAFLLLAGCARGTAPASPEPSPSESPGASASPSATAPPTASGQPGGTASASPSPPADEDPVAARIAGMSLDQKIGQLIIAGFEGKKLDDETKRMIREDRIGGVILYADNVSGVHGTVRLVNQLKAANAGNPVPLFISTDQEGGRVSRLPDAFAAMPSSRAVGRKGDPKLARQMGSLLARELRATGFNMNFAPVLDIDSNPDNPVIGDRSFGRSAKIVAELGLAEMDGISKGGVISVVKHFPGHGDTSVDSHLDLPVLRKSSEQLAALEWIPFQAAVKAGADAVMVAHILFPRIDPNAPASLSDIIVGKQLRGQMNYDGVVMTDDLTMGAITKQYGLAEAAVAAIDAGSDIVLVAHGYDNERQVFEALRSAVRNGRLTEARIDESVRRILTLKNKYRLTDAEIPLPTAAEIAAINKSIEKWLSALDAKA